MDAAVLVKADKVNEVPWGWDDFISLIVQFKELKVEPQIAWNIIGHWSKATDILQKKCWGKLLINLEKKS